MKSAYLFEVYDRLETLAHVLVWHEPTFEKDADPEDAEMRAAYGLRRSASQEAEEHAVREIYRAANRLNAGPLANIAAASGGENDGKGWVILLICPEGQRPSLAGFTLLSEATDKSHLHRLEIA